MPDILETLTISEKVMLSALLQALPSDSGTFSFERLIENKLTPSTYMTVTVLQRLMDIGVISSNSKAADDLNTMNCVDEIFTFKSQFESADPQQLINDIINTANLSDDDLPQITALSKNTLISECIEYLSDLTLTYIENDTLSENLFNNISFLLELNSLGQVKTLLQLASFEFPNRRVKAPNSVVLCLVCDRAMESYLHQIRRDDNPILDKSVSPDRKEDMLTKHVRELLFEMAEHEYFNTPGIKLQHMLRARYSTELSRPA